MIGLSDARTLWREMMMNNVDIDDEYDDKDSRRVSSDSKRGG